MYSLRSCFVVYVADSCDMSVSVILRKSVASCRVAADSSILAENDRSFDVHCVGLLVVMI